MQNLHSAIILVYMLNLKSFRQKRPTFSVDKIVKNPKSTALEVDKWLISDFVTNVLTPITKNRPFPLDEQMLMTSAVCLARPNIIFDWGTHVGTSARVFYEITQYFQIDCEIHSIDLPDEEDHVEHPGEMRGQLVKNLSNVFLHQGDGVSTALKLYKAKERNNALFYIDGDHSYDSVFRELSMILKSVKKPTVLLHDTFFQSNDSGYNIGPHQAIIDVLKKSMKQPEVVRTSLGLPGMTLLIFR